VADHNALRTHEHLADEQAKDSLTLGNRGALGNLPQPLPKAFEVLRELEVRLPVHRLGFHGFQLSAQGRGLLPQIRHPAECERSPEKAGI
jgi:hypothetical protein